MPYAAFAGAMLAIGLLWPLLISQAAAGPLDSPTRLAFQSPTRVLVSDYLRNAVLVLDAGTLATVQVLSVAGVPVGVAWGAGRIFVGNETRGAVEVYTLVPGTQVPPRHTKRRDADHRRRDKTLKSERRQRLGDHRARREEREAKERRDVRRKEEADDDHDGDHDGDHDDETDHDAEDPPGGKAGYVKRYDLGAGAGAVGNPTDIAVDEAQQLVFVVDGIARNVKVFAVTGALLRTLPDPATGAPPLEQPTGIALDPVRGEVLVSDFGAAGTFRGEAWVRIYGYDGSYRGAISGNVVPGYRFSRPQGLAVSDAGQVLLVDSLLGQVLVFDRLTLQGVAKAGTFGTARGQLMLPLDVALQPRSGTLFVTNNRNGRVEVFPRAGW